MKQQDFLPYLNKFVLVKLQDGTLDSGYISNPEDFDANDDTDIKVILLNGLLYSEIYISNIIEIKEVNREDTTKIPIVGFEESNEDNDIKLEELYEKSLLDDFDFTIEDLMKKDTDD